MADILTLANIGAIGDLLRLTDQATATAAGSGDATSTTGVTVDRLGYSTGGIPATVLAGVLWEATLASGKTLAMALTVQDSADNSAWSDFVTVASAVVATGGSGGTVVKGQTNVSVDLRSARRYFRLNFQPDLNAAGTDTAKAVGAGFIAGFDRLPAPTN